LPFSWRAVGTALAGSVLKFDGNLLGSRRRRASSMGSSQTSAKKDMAEATFAQLPLDLVLGRSSDLDRVGERRSVGVVVFVGGGGVVGAESAAIGHPVAPVVVVVVGAHGPPLVFWLLYNLPAGNRGRSQGLGLVKTAGCEGGGRRPWGMAAAVPRSRGGTSSNQWAYEPYLYLPPVDGAMNRIDGFDLSTIRNEKKNLV